MNINEAIMFLIGTQEFYGKLLLQMRIISTRQVPIAGVNVTDRPNLFLNPDTFTKMPLVEQVAVLQHELMHLLEDHLSRAVDMGADHNNFNIAADLSINQIIPLMKEVKTIQPLMIDKFKEMFPDIKEDREAEYYMEFFDEQAQNGGMGQAGEGNEHSDGHLMWNKGNPDSKVVKDLTKSAIQNAAKSCDPGNIPGEVKEALKRLTEPSQNWRRLLRNFVANQVNTLKKPTRARRNRRYGLAWPAKRKKRMLKLGFVIDTSGSMSLESISQASPELDAIFKGVTKEIVVIECDTQIQNKFNYTLGCMKEISGRGGTIYQPAFDEAIKEKCDAIIMFGDGGCFDTPRDPKIPVLWAMVEGTEKPVAWGREIQITFKKDK